MRPSPPLLVLCFALCCPLLAQTAKTTSKAGVKKPVFDNSIPANQVEGSCDELSQYRQEHGVTASDGEHPGFAGWTIAQFEYSKWTYNATPAKKTGVYCGCNGQTYPTETQCVTNCKAGMGCFNGNIICKGPPPGDCEKTKVNITFIPHTSSYQLNWTPAKPNSACSSAIAAWKNRVAAHEQHHVDDANNIADQANAAWKNKEVTACGKTPAEIKSDLTSQIQSAIQSQMDQMENDFNTRGANFHNTPEGSPAIDPSCSVCK
jgi:hypothetical protein